MTEGRHDRSYSSPKPFHMQGLTVESSGLETANSTMRTGTESGRNRRRRKAFRMTTVGTAEGIFAYTMDFDIGQFRISFVPCGLKTATAERAAN